MWQCGAAHVHTRERAQCLHRDHLMEEPNETKQNEMEWYGILRCRKKKVKRVEEECCERRYIFIHAKGNSNERQEMLKLIFLAAHH